ncbi:tyrosinase family protein [Streptomyces sp. NBC_01006]|uniref:tyrosinase family protein n=1 Tax=Streptomyces sp. NBC_01006 TaxID=2903716 RepID=UPI00386D5471|nr:tyrosinase family protein [Streptomyces sp. NBC_01006]
MDRRSMLRLGAVVAAGSGLGLWGVAASGASAPQMLVRRRPDAREMTPQQWQAFVNALKKLNTPAGGNQYSKFTADHYAVGSGAHGSPGFFVWHRYFLRQFEKALQEIDPSVSLPYWDVTRDSQAPERSFIFSESYMGGNGGSDGRGGALNAPFVGWRVPSANSGLVARYFSRGTTIPSWTAPEILNSYLDHRASYDAIRQQIESTFSRVHAGIGGNNGDMSFMYTTNDPIYWVFACFIDLVYAEWQKRHPDRTNDYPTDPKKTRIASYDGVYVAEVFDTRALGYTYNRWNVNQPTPSPSSTA